MNVCKQICTIFFIAISLSITAQEGSWINLVEGDDLSQWERLNGTADYSAQDGTVTGTAKLGTPNTFLSTKKIYADFILELEVYDDARLNSGIQIRSQSKAAYMNGRVHGYQVEIDPSPRAWSGGLYDEARRGWLVNLTENEKGRKAFINGQWNAYHIEAIGHEIRVWVNGVNTANLVDDVDAQGFISLQVHSISDPGVAGAQVKWRNVRIKTTDLEKDRWAVQPHAVEVNWIPNTLTERERKTGWRLLFDGKTTKGWKSARSDEFPERGWVVNDGTLTVEATSGGESTGGGDIITVDKFSNFDLCFEFRLTEGANSGVKYYVDPALNKGPGSSIGMEYQILDDQNHPDAKMGVGGNRTLGSLYDLIAAQNLSVPGRNKTVTNTGGWNRGRIKSKDDKIQHWLNGEKVVEYTRNNQMFRALVAYSKYKVWPGFGELPEGHILLQDHGDEVSFRNIKIREF